MQIKDMLKFGRVFLTPAFFEYLFGRVGVGEDLQKHIRKTNIKIIKKKVKNVRKYIDKSRRWSYNKFNKREEKTLKNPRRVLQ